MNKATDYLLENFLKKLLPFFIITTTWSRNNII